MRLKILQPVAGHFDMNAFKEKFPQFTNSERYLPSSEPDSRLEMAMDALRCPPGDTPVNLLDNVAGWILELDRGQGIPWKGNYSSWLEQKRNRLQQEEAAESERQKTLQRELEWIRMPPKGRYAKSKARISSYEEMLRQDTDKG